MRAPLRPAGIIGVGSYTPPRVLTNSDLEKMVDTSDEWIRTRTGISERRIADADTASSDLALQASRAALASAGLQPEDIQLVIVATITPDMQFPCTASLLQHALGAPGAAAFDLSVGCTGFVYALAVASAMVSAGVYRHVVVTAAETLSKITDWEDRRTCVLFGDGAGSVVVGPAEEGHGILSYCLGNEGEGQEHLVLPGGGSRHPATAETVANRMHYLRMNGAEVFKFAVRAMVDSSEKAVQEAGLRLDDIDYVIPHQANLRIVDAAAKRLNIPFERFARNGDRYGNTSAATIPLALDEAVKAGTVKPGMNLLLSSFGAGLSWGSMVLRW